MAKRLTDKERKKIIAAYIECQNYSAVARQFGVACNTIKKIVESDAATARKVEQKREENVLSVLQHMESKKQDVCFLIDKLLAAIDDPDKIAATPLSQLATTMGIIIDKYTSNELAKTIGAASLADSIRIAYDERVAKERAAKESKEDG